MARLNNILQENILLKRKISQYQQVLGILPYVDDSIFKGGFRVVGTLEDRNKIECCYRKHGMIVIVVGSDHSYKQYRLISNNCTNSWEEVVYQFDADETKVDLVEDYSEIGGPNLETQRDLNLALKAYVLALQQQIDNIDVEVDDNEVHITEDTSQASIGDTQRDFNRNVASTVDANIQSIGALNNNKVNKTNLTVSGPDSIFKYVYIFNENSDPRRMLAGDLGKNIANSNLTSVAGAGMNLGSTYTWNAGGQFFYMTGLPDKSSDQTFNRLVMQDNNSQMSYSNGKLWFMNIPTLMTVTERNDWITKMNVDIANTYLQLVTVIDGNFINGTSDFIITIYGLNINALNGLTQVTFELVGPDGNPVPDNMFDVTSYSVNSNSELAVSFHFEPSYTFITGEYTLRIIKQLVVLGEVGITAYNSFTEGDIPDGDFTLTNNGMTSATYSAGSFNVTASAGNAKIVTTNPLNPAQDYDIEYVGSGVFRENNFGASNINYWTLFVSGLTLDGNTAYVGSGVALQSNALNFLRGQAYRIMTGATNPIGYEETAPDETQIAITLKTVIQKRSNRYKVIIYRASNNALLYVGTYTNTNNDPIYFMIQFIKQGAGTSQSASAINVRKRIYI